MNCRTALRASVRGRFANAMLEGIKQVAMTGPQSGESDSNFVVQFCFLRVNKGWPRIEDAVWAKLVDSFANDLRMDFI